MEGETVLEALSSMGHLGRSPGFTGTPQVLHMSIYSHQTRGSSPSLQDTRGEIPVHGNGDDKKLKELPSLSILGKAPSSPVAPCGRS